LIHQLRGNLDWIAMKCLEKDRTRRYDTANGLAADIQRHLSNDPVAARPPSTAYRFQKMIRRNKVAVVAAAAVLTALVIGISTWLFVKERAARHRAVAAERQQDRLRQQAETALTQAAAAEKKAAEEAAMAKAVSDFLRSDLLQTAGSEHQSDYLEMPPNPNLTVVEAMDRATERIGGRFHNQPLVEAAIRYTIGLTCHDLGGHWAAITHLERALELRRPRLGLEHDYTRMTMSALAGAYIGAGRPTNALPLYAQCLSLARERFGPGDSETANALSDLGLCRLHAHRTTAAIRLLEEVLNQGQASSGRENRNTAATLASLAQACSQARQPARAVAFAEQSLNILKARLGPDHPTTITVTYVLADNYFKAGRPNDGLPLLEEALWLSRARQGSESFHLLDMINLLAQQYQKLGREAEAEALVHESAQIASKLREKAPSRMLGSLRLHADYLLDRGRFAEAEPLYREAAQLSRAAASDPKHLEPGVGAFAVFLHRQSRDAEAEPLYREHLQSQLRRHSISNDDDVGTTASLGRLLADWAWAERTNSVAAEVTRPASKSEDRGANTESDQSLLTPAATRLGLRWPRKKRRDNASAIRYSLGDANRTLRSTDPGATAAHSTRPPTPEARGGVHPLGSGPRVVSTVGFA
jgi:tetratricopeptide (TPR) repeat protein